MSNRRTERAQTGGGGGGGGAVDVTAWGGVAVSPAAPKTDGQSAALVVPEFGAREQLFNGVSWDPARAGFVTPVTGPFLGYQNAFSMGVFNAIAPVLVDGQAITLQFDVNGQLKTSGGGGGASIGLVGAPVPLSANYTGFIDAAGNLQGAHVYDLDTGAGTELAVGVNLRISGAGGSVEVGTVASPLNVRTSTESALGPLATEATLATRASEATLATRASEATLATRASEATLATRASEATLATRAAAAQLPAALVGGRLDVNVGASVLPTGAATEATLATRAASAQFPAALVGGRLDENVGAWMGSVAPTVGQKTMADSLPVVFASNQTSIPVANTPVQPANSAVTSVASNLASVTILAANANRKGAMITNDGTGNLYLKLGAAASTVSFTTKLIPGAYYEVPSPVYTGIIDGIWDVAVGSARVTETTP